MNEHWLLRADNKLQRLYWDGPHRGVGSGVGYLGLKFWKHHLTVVDLYRSLSDGYLFGAIAACKALNDDSSQVTKSRCWACYFSAMHSVEIFLKALIIKKNCSVAKIHHIEALRDKAYESYPWLADIWDVPFCTQVLGCNDKNKAKLLDLYPLYQVSRYPTDKKGKVWSGYMEIEPNKFSQSLENIKSKMNEVSTRVFG